MARVKFTDGEYTLDLWVDDAEIVLELRDDDDIGAPPAIITLDIDTSKKLIERIEELIFDLEQS